MEFSFFTLFYCLRVLGCGSLRSSLKLSSFLENILEGERKLRGPEIVVRFVFLYGSAAFGAREFVEAGVDPAYSEFKLKVPVLGQDPVVAIANSGTCAPSLVTVVGELREVAAEEFNMVLDVADVELSAYKVEAPERSLESFAKPYAEFRLCHPVAPAAVVDVPGVELTREVEGPVLGHLQFDTEVRRSSRVADKVGLDAHMLGGYAHPRG